MVYEWGIAAPAEAPTVYGYSYNVVVYDWELDYLTDNGYKFTLSSGDYDCTYQWEIAQIEGTPQFNDTKTVISTGQWETNGNASTDKYQLKYTYCRKSGDLLLCESNPSPTAESTLENYFTVEWATPADTSITHVRVYRTLANFGDFYYADEFGIDATYGVVGTEDEDLGSLVETDHDRPPLGTVVAGPDFNGVCFMGFNNFLYYSKPKQPEYWPTEWFLTDWPNAPH